MKTTAIICGVFPINVRICVPFKHSAVREEEPFTVFIRTKRPVDMVRWTPEERRMFVDKRIRARLRRRRWNIFITVYVTVDVQRPRPRKYRRFSFVFFESVLYTVNMLLYVGRLSRRISRQLLFASRYLFIYSSRTYQRSLHLANYLRLVFYTRGTQSIWLHGRYSR